MFSLQLFSKSHVFLSAPLELDAARDTAVLVTGHKTKRVCALEKPDQTSSWATCSGWPCSSTGLDQLISRGAFQPPAICDSVINCLQLFLFPYSYLFFILRKNGTVPKLLYFLPNTLEKLSVSETTEKNRTWKCYLASNGKPSLWPSRSLVLSGFYFHLLLQRS